MCVKGGGGLRQAHVLLCGTQNQSDTHIESCAEVNAVRSVG